MVRRPAELPQVCPTLAALLVALRQQQRDAGISPDGPLEGGTRLVTDLELDLVTLARLTAKLTVMLGSPVVGAVFEATGTLDGRVRDISVARLARALSAALPRPPDDLPGADRRHPGAGVDRWALGQHENHPTHR